MITKHQVSTKLVGISISLSLFLSGSILLGSQPAHAASASATSVASNIISTGERFLGVPYRFGAASGRTDAFDCSSFVQYIFKQNGISLPRSSRQQSQVGIAVPKSQLQPGDLVFSDTNRDGIINHVGVYMGNGKVLHSYRVGIGVTISNYIGSTWDRTFVTARRIIPNSGQAVAPPKPVVKPGKNVQPPANHAPVHRNNGNSGNGENQ